MTSAAPKCAPTSSCVLVVGFNVDNCVLTSFLVATVSAGQTTTNQFAPAAAAAPLGANATVEAFFLALYDTRYTTLEVCVPYLRSRDSTVMQQPQQS